MWITVDLSIIPLPSIVCSFPSPHSIDKASSLFLSLRESNLFSPHSLRSLKIIHYFPFSIHLFSTKITLYFSFLRSSGLSKNRPLFRRILYSTRSMCNRALFSFSPFSLSTFSLSDHSKGGVAWYKSGRSLSSFRTKGKGIDFRWKRMPKKGKDGERYQALEIHRKFNVSHIIDNSRLNFLLSNS